MAHYHKWQSDLNRTSSAGEQLIETCFIGDCLAVRVTQSRLIEPIEWIKYRNRTIAKFRNKVTVIKDYK